MSNESRNGFGFSSRRTESLWVLTMRVPLTPDRCRRRTPRWYRPRLTAYHREPGAASALVGEAGQGLKPAASTQRVASRTKVVSTWRADEPLEVVAEPHHLVALRACPASATLARTVRPAPAAVSGQRRTPRRGRKEPIRCPHELFTLVPS